tara:strand:+ start:1674 stop:2561 length:888 start_codon:yes stop_codon:yes gene_type:complete
MNMTYFEQSKNDRCEPVGYLLTIIIAFIAFVLGQIISNDFSIAILGHSITESSEGTSTIIFAMRLLPFSFFLIGLVLGLKVIQKRKILTLFTARESFDWKRFFLSFILWGCILLISLTLAHFGGIDFEYNFNLSAFIPLLIVSLSLLFLQITAEEVFFRGFLLQSLNRIIPIGIIPILLSGTLFGLMHLGNPEVAKLGYGILAYYIGTGIFFGVLTRMDDGLELSMGYHFMNNFFAAVILTNDWQAFHTDAILIDHAEPTLGFEIFLTILFLQPLLLLIFSRVYKWTNWKERIWK